MAMEPMYPAVNNSVPTSLAALLSGTDTVISVANAAVLPPGPNIATIGADDNAELVYYTEIIDNTLTGCIRGYNGTMAQVWPEGTAVCRAYTAVDHDAFIDNIKSLDAGKLAVDGDGSEVKVILDPEAEPPVVPEEPPIPVTGTLKALFTGLRGFVRWVMDKISSIGQPNGIATLDTNGRLAQQMPDIANMTLQNATLINGATSTSGIQYGRYNGIGVIAGRVTLPLGGNNLLFATLPAGYRPNATMIAIAFSTGSALPPNARFFIISPNGNVSIHGGVGPEEFNTYLFSVTYLIGG